MEITEKFRGNTAGIILFVLLGGDRHTDELKEIIDKKFSEVKIGTLYSIIARMKTQGQIAEYRASSFDGSRRKYYKITDLGRNVYDSDYSHLFLDYDIIKPIEIKVESVKEQTVEKTPEPIEDDVYLKYVKKAELIDEEPEIDFSAVQIEEPKVEPNVVENEQNSPIYDVDDTEIEPREKEIDYDSVVSSSYEYKSVLNQLFPKSKVNFDDYDEYSYNAPIINEEAPKQTSISVVNDNLNTLFEISEKENIKIRTSVDTNRYQGAKILANKVRFHSAILITLLAVIEFLLLSVIFSKVTNFNSKALITILIIFGAFTLVTGVVYALKHSHAVKDLPKFINSIEIAIVLAIGIMIISICVASISGVDLYNFSEIYYSILIPAVMACNIPLYVAIVHFISKLDFYQSI